ncbi:MAG: hypothetical protein NTW96_21130, partial [Planctomycetia bacterium]|nr:hypothetical protein [Planctomycetia bacterium]
MACASGGWRAMISSVITASMPTVVTHNRHPSPDQFIKNTPPRCERLHNYFNLFPAFPRNDTVFVAMSFVPEFDRRWQTVIAPAISSVVVNGNALRAERVDTRRIGDSILTEILTHIRDARLIFGDVTSLGKLADRPIRNGNVMYEIGIAHAVRPAEEVLLFRSDSDPLLFDVANIRVNTYAPEDEPNSARKIVSDSLVEALREVDLRKQLAVQTAAHTLDAHAWCALAATSDTGTTKMQPRRSIAQALLNDAHNEAIIRLLQLGAFETEYPRVTSELLQTSAQDRVEDVMAYRITPFGKAILQFGLQRMGVFDPEVQAIFESLALKEAT